MTNQTLDNPTTARKIWGLLDFTERRSAVVLLSLMFVGTVLETLGVGLIIPAIVLLTQRDFAGKYAALQPALQLLGNPSQQSLAIGGMLLLVGVYLIKALFLSMLAFRQARFAFGIQMQLSQRLFTIYLHQPYTFYLQRNSAHLIRNVISEVDLITNTAIAPGMMLLTESLVFASLCSLLLLVEPVGALVVITVLGIAAWGFHQLTQGRIARWGEARLHHDRLRMQHAQQGLGGAKDVKLLGREEDFLERYSAHNIQTARAAQFYQTLLYLPRIWLEVLAATGLAILVVSMLLQDRTLEAVLPTLGLFAAAAFRLMPSVNRMLNSIQTLRYGLPVINTLYAELKLSNPQTPSAHTPATPFCTALELDRVTYTYPNTSQPALEDISLTILRGELVGFVGTSGAGKSTLVDIFLGLLTPDSGEVRVDGKNIEHALRNWQDQIGYVPQLIYLTDDTLARNIGFGLPDAQINEAAVWRAIRAAQLEDFVYGQPAGLDTVVGERGVRLSGGQCQRIGIARALYHDPAVLVLDEATSSLDTATEYSVMQAVRALQGTKTILVVAHRFSTVEHCDRLYRLERGRLVGEGTPQTMLASRASAYR